MLDFLKKKVEINTTQIVNEIESAVYAHVRLYGFKKHGRTLHRFVSEDISQIIHFQCGLRGLRGLLCVNIGIRVPECFERSFQPMTEKKKYYHEYECTIRARLGEARGKKETWYNLKQRTDKIIKKIIAELDRFVLPSFDVLSSRESILMYREDYPFFKTYGSILLDECMIYGRLGNREKAKELFDMYYQSTIDEYDNRMKKGHKQYLRKGERIVYMGQDITASKHGYVTLYGGNHRHIDYLNDLASKLGLR